MVAAAMLTLCLTVMKVGAETGENWEGCRERERERRVQRWSCRERGRGEFGSERSEGERIGNWEGCRERERGRGERSHGERIGKVVG